MDRRQCRHPVRLVTSTVAAPDRPPRGWGDRLPRQHPCSARGGRQRRRRRVARRRPRSHARSPTSSPFPRKAHHPPSPMAWRDFAGWLWSCGGDWDRTAERSLETGPFRRRGFLTNSVRWFRRPIARWPLGGRAEASRRLSALAGKIRRSTAGLAPSLRDLAQSSD